MPAYPSDHSEEKYAIDQYVFGPYKDFQTGVIEDLDRAVELLHLFERSPRRFELIYVSKREQDRPPDGGSIRLLGWDVANTGGDFYSIVGDFPEVEEFRDFFAQVNEFGLFASRWTAELFLQRYRNSTRVDRNDSYSIFQVWGGIGD